MHPWKAAEPDGIHAAFYQHFWGIIKKEATDLIIDLFMGTRSME